MPVRTDSSTASKSFFTASAWARASSYTATLAVGLAGRGGVTRAGSFGAARLLGWGVVLRRDGCGVVLRRDDEASVRGAADAAGDRAGDAERMAG